MAASLAIVEQTQPATNRCLLVLLKWEIQELQAERLGEHQTHAERRLLLQVDSRWTKLLDGEEETLQARCAHIIVQTLAAVEDTAGLEQPTHMAAARAVVGLVRTGPCQMAAMEA
jgi:hypothetical protein